MVHKSRKELKILECDFVASTGLAGSKTLQHL